MTRDAAAPTEPVTLLVLYDGDHEERLQYSENLQQIIEANSEGFRQIAYSAWLVVTTDPDQLMHQLMDAIDPEGNLLAVELVADSVVRGWLGADTWDWFEQTPWASQRSSRPSRVESTAP